MMAPLGKFSNPGVAGGSTRASAMYNICRARCGVTGEKQSDTRCRELLDQQQCRGRKSVEVEWIGGQKTYVYCARELTAMNKSK